MRLRVWILEPDTAIAADLAAAWRSVAGDRVILRIFSSLPPIPEAELPDLLMAEIASRCDEVTELLIKLRELASTDFLPITTDHSPSSFTRAQQLGAIDYILKPFSPRRLRRSLRRYLSLKQGLSAGSALTQGQLDRFFFSGDSRRLLPLASCSEVELQHCRQVMEVLLHLPRQQCLAEEMAAELSFSRVTARKYLDMLVEAGYVEKTLQRTRTGTGRPRNLYTLKGDLL